MEKKLIVWVIFLAFLILNVVGFIGFHALSDQTPKAEAILENYFAKIPECSTYCGGAPLSQWETCMIYCVFVK
ncbi:MAG: hypothetical protein KAT34_13190 [Candidatus Aminicenantes bacterium]|nr:hypothetical protein [Candidatus Aminicenantes bacterium]